MTLDLFRSECSCSLVTVGARRWCVTPYAQGGCGKSWERRNGCWRLTFDGRAFWGFA